MSNTIAVRPFLSAEEVAAELGTTELNVHRLVAIGVLKGHHVGSDKLRVAAEDIAAYVAAGMPQFEGPQTSQSDDWIHELQQDGDRERFFAEAVRILFEVANAADPYPMVDGKPVLRVKVGIRNPKIRELVFRSAREDSPFDRLAEAFAAVKVRNIARRLVDRSRTKTVADALAGKTGLRGLYSPAFQSVTDEAWERFITSSIVVGRDIVAPRPESGRDLMQRFSWHLSHGDLNLDKAKVIKLAF